MLASLVILLSYLLGSIPFGYLIVRWNGGGDVRETGSGGTGATNVTRRAGKGAGLLTLALDALKGALAVILARALLAEDFGVNLHVAGAALAAIAGHCFPVWLKFRGGKGVATGVGVFLVLAPLALLCALPVFVALVALTRYVSLGSIAATASLSPFVWLLYDAETRRQEFFSLIAVALAGGAFIIFMHRANIRRLLNGTESKLRL